MTFKRRERVLSDAELAALAAPDNDYGRILQLLILTGCRRDEIGGLKWSEIDMGARTITPRGPFSLCVFVPVTGL